MFEKASLLRRYYDRYDHRCRRFYYGGCEGNENRFQTLEECSAACHYEPPSDRERCFQPHDPGTCDNDIERWFFDMNKKQCVCRGLLCQKVQLRYFHKPGLHIKLDSNSPNHLKL
ncbi:Kunitz/Bovine pancreatic trypsin inhibitor domain protein [Necator americanus]|uniref:Kunitz/Bovine pancreatic trypsin inhibitor domain protein n=1 Tax=Necator americanus TaxID=51031 RepID=W2TKE6_NECAM|nr:Kunitz/Bovine pancreatic trypsin inhibitor domain protein [Necator americanus]ETN82099.1 Kunitz/Bovine pancreatic trypsin inhibitor domain protein [Necator americanus]